MLDSHFSFIERAVLRQNLDQAFDHILTLLPFIESDDYNEEAKSAFRKTIIIYTASIIEALLFYILDSEFDEDDLASSDWEFQSKKVLYVVDDSHEIVAGDFKKKSLKVVKDKLNLGQINNILKDKSIIGESIYKKVDEVRIFRNDQHIGPHKKVKTYSKVDLEKAFNAASTVKDFVMQWLSK